MDFGATRRRHEQNGRSSTSCRPHVVLPRTAWWRSMPRAAWHSSTTARVLRAKSIDGHTKRRAVASTKRPWS